MCAPGCAMQTCLTLAHRRPTNQTRPASYFAPEASRPPVTFLSFIAMPHCSLDARSRPLVTRCTASCHLSRHVRFDPASWTLVPKLDLRDNGTPIDQAPPHSHNRRSCRSRSRTRISPLSPILLGPGKNQRPCTGPTIANRTGPESSRVFRYFSLDYYTPMG